MRASRLFSPTLRKVADAELPGHRLLLRGGFIRPLASGLYSLLPLGWRVLQKIENIVREEMDHVDGQETLLPTLHPEELWVRSGRASKWGPELMRLTDRNNRVFCLGATHEEVITALVAAEARSYRQLPIMLYQIATKFRDEPRPRGGLIRCREFGMKDAYSFDRDKAGTDAVYDEVVEAYKRILKRMELPFRVTLASGGYIGGTDTREFMLISEAGEDALLLCSKCSYGASPDVADWGEKEIRERDTEMLAIERAATPGMRTVEQVTGFLSVRPSEIVKTIICSADGKPVAALVRGDHELNLDLLKKVLGVRSIELAGENMIRSVTRAPVGFAGPVGLENIKIITDEEIKALANFVTGGNEIDLHLKNVNWGRDFEVNQWARLRYAQPGDPCLVCNAPLEAARGIELAHVFKLGTIFSAPLDAAYLDEQGERHFIEMGCYGFGTTRAIAAIAEYSRDENGIIWPLSVAPYQVIIIVVNMEEKAQADLGQSLYQALSEKGLEVVFEDRDERAGVKFKDADLTGIPLQIVVGKHAADGRVEVRRRGRQEKDLVSPEQAIEWCDKEVKSALSEEGIS
ncbi:MAG: proline--tRNA ligase [Armatimonadetes bacterium]|nr:proline--tRNA ligase [Armatimonadota bacterium]NIO75536.1 proline--tRNA ligase [Armatimonadota bacterium]NIO95913.1 proline--tRNA ligase [Armatimonadota bacterium]